LIPAGSIMMVLLVKFLCLFFLGIYGILAYVAYLVLTQPK